MDLVRSLAASVRRNVGNMCDSRWFTDCGCQTQQRGCFTTPFAEGGVRGAVGDPASHERHRGITLDPVNTGHRRETRMRTTDDGSRPVPARSLANGSVDIPFRSVACRSVFSNESFVCAAQGRARPSWSSGGVQSPATSSRHRQVDQARRGPKGCGL